MTDQLRVAREHRDKIERVLREYIERLRRVPDDALSDFMRKRNAELIAYFEAENERLDALAGEVEPA